MASLDLTAFDAVLKSLYQSQDVEDATYKGNPMLAMLKKEEDFYGKNYPLPIQYGKPQGRSATFATAQSNAAASKFKDFLLTRVSDHAVCTIDNETMEASENNSGAFTKAVKTEVDGILDSLSRSLAIGLFRDSSGYIGQVLAEPTETTSTTFTLLEVNDIVNYEVGQVLNIWSAKSGGSQRNRNGSATDLTVSAVDRGAGTVTCTGAYDSSGTIAANDYIFVAGDRGAKISGLEAWLPASAPTNGDSHFGVDRSADVTRLAGIRYDASALPIEEGLIQGLALGSREGAAPSVGFINPLKMAELVKSMGARVTYSDAQAHKRADIGFKAVVIQGPEGEVKMIADRNCPFAKCYMLDMETWILKSLGKVPRINDTDGNRMLRQQTADGVEVRAVYRAQLGCSKPGANMVISL
jgi:hypothetical protein